MALAGFAVCPDATARAQAVQDPESTCVEPLHAWVDPCLGLDPPASALTSQINDPDRPYKKLQTAIDALQVQLDSSYQPPPAQKVVGIVHALPGLYGPHANGSGDVFPIVMRDRVSVQGVSARACVMRGGGTTTVGMFWPNAPTSGTYPVPREVLVTWEYSTPPSPKATSSTARPAWTDEPDTREFIDAWTFQGGDVQMYVGDIPGGNWEINARISNCVFDLRDGWKATPASTSTVAGPYFGIMMVSTFELTASGLGYFDRRAVIANNTFAFAEWARPDAASAATWIHDSRPDAAGIIDVVNPGCQVPATSGLTDANQSLRGVSRPIIINNLFRTRPTAPSDQTKAMAMIGIDERDTQVSSGGAYRETNVFAADRVGSSNAHAGTATFFSQVAWAYVVGQHQYGVPPYFTIPFLNCAQSPPLTNPAGCCSGCGAGLSCSTPPPAPSSAVPLWNNTASAGNAEFDPAFVGEYVNTFLTPSPYYAYRDWRLLPGSKMQDKGISIGATALQPHPTLTAQNGTQFKDSVCPDLRLFDLDGEGWGNPRVIGLEVDVGFDESHGLIMAGSWANDTISHNLPTLLSPSADAGVPTRTVILPFQFSGVSLSMRATQRQIYPLPYPFPAWTSPPSTLSSPILDPTLNDPEYRIKYINLSGPSVAGIPSTLSVGVGQYFPIGGQTGAAAIQFGSASFSDVEPSVGSGHIPGRYLNLQGVLSDDIVGSQLLRWTNLQFEYR